jgi:hypothetical protein
MTTFRARVSIGIPLVVIVPVTPSNLPQNIPAPKCWTRNNPIECVSSIFQAVAALGVCFMIVCAGDAFGVGVTTGVVCVLGVLEFCCVFAANSNIKVVAIVSTGVKGRNIKAPFWG